MPEKGPTAKCIAVVVCAVLAAVIAIIASSFADVGYSEVFVLKLNVNVLFNIMIPRYLRGRNVSLLQCF